ncbi:PspA-associated protein PspAB [Nocardioides caricicola]|uniref:GAF domain-containing protein n=1 Tax=Nocardioides caricicola TaxID=634770 RepID=A0ABW0MXR1_9ACTN
MGLWDVITGRSRPKPAKLDMLFAVPTAAITLETTLGLRPTGSGSVCYRAAAGAAFQQTQDEVVALLDADPGAPPVQVTRDEFGFTWLLNQHDPADVSGLCTDLHAVNTALESQGFGPGLLCSLVPFVDDTGRRVGLVYLYKQATFYPFAPRPGADRVRDNMLEIQVRDALTGELPIEQDLGRWLAVWGAPGL